MNKSSLQLIAIFILFLHLLQPASAHNKSHSDGKKHKSSSSSSGSGAGSGQVQVEVSLKGSFSQVVAFGDSYTDTGNCMFMNGLRRFFGGLIAHSPYGSIFKSPATGNRFCDGRLVIDFLCEALGLPHLPPYKDPKVNVTHGVNFAVSGSTSLTSDLFSKYKIGQGLLWKSMVPQNFMTQLDWFDEFIEKMAASRSGSGNVSSSQRGSGQISGGSATSGQVGGGASGGGSIGGSSIGGKSSGGGFIGGGSAGGGNIGGRSSGGGSIGGGSSVGGSIGGGGSSGGGSIGGGSSGGGIIGGGSSSGGSISGGSTGGGSIGGGSSGGGSIGGGSSGGGSIGGSFTGGSNIGGGSSGGGSIGGGSAGGGNIGGGSAGGGSIGGSSIGGGSVDGGSASGSGQIGGSGQVSGSGQAGGSASSSGQISGSGQAGIDLVNILVWIGEMGVNDYARIISTSTLTGNWLSQISVNHVTKILKAVLDKGAKYVVVQGLPPVGCLPLALSFAPDSGRDKHGCSEAINTLVKFHNQILQKKIAEFQAEHKDCVIAYADYYSAYFTIMTNVTVYKVQEPLKACCGAGSGPFNFSPKLLCGAGSTAKCNDPSKYIVWDGLHLTEAMHSHLADLFFNKGYRHPSLHEMIAHKSKCA